MGIHSFTKNNDDDDDGTGGGNVGGGFGPMSALTGSGGDPTDMLIDYNTRFKAANPALFRDGLVTQTISVLSSKMKPNALLIGGAGVGKTCIVEEIARLIANGDPSIPAQLQGHTIWELPLSNIVAGSGMVGALEEKMAELIDYLSDASNKAILFIDEIHQLVKSPGGQSMDPTYQKISQILKPALARGDVRVIGATTNTESRGFDHDPAFQRRFSTLIVDELTREQTIEVLKVARGPLVQHYLNKITVTDEALHDAAVIADETSLASSHRPDNALTLLDRTMADVHVRHQASISRAQARNDQATLSALQAVTSLPVNDRRLREVAMRLATGMAEKPSFDKDQLRQKLSRLKGQDDVLDGLVENLVRDQLSVFPRTKPTAWMFAGPSGVGKTEATKIIAEGLTNEEPIMLNMGEYHNKHDTAKILGSPPGYVGSDSSRELPFDSLASNPYRVILLDEFEKASDEVKRLFLTALDEGWMQMASGKKIDFTKATIIATTNAAREILGKRQSIGFTTESGPSVVSHQEMVKALQEAFPPELLGRFSSIVGFAPIDRDVYRDIVEASYERERSRLLEENKRMGQRLTATIDPDVLRDIVRDSFLADQGARPAFQEVRRHIENQLMAPVSSLPQTAVNDDDSALGQSPGAPADTVPAATVS